jgi:hypothetical protein
MGLYILNSTVSFYYCFFNCRFICSYMLDIVKIDVIFAINRGFYFNYSALFCRFIYEIRIILLLFINVFRHFFLCITHLNWCVIWLGWLNSFNETSDSYFFSFTIKLFIFFLFFINVFLISISISNFNFYFIIWK